MTKAELAILAAIREVENLPADERLTSAAIALDRARRQVADFVDDVPRIAPVPGAFA